MSLATSESGDPVLAVIELLEGTPEEEWPSKKPTYIETMETVQQRTKHNRTDPAVYVYSPVDGPRERMGVPYDTVMQSEGIDADVWMSRDDVGRGIPDAVVAILENYATDNREHTEWVYVRPEFVADRRAETIARRSNHSVVSVRVELMRDAPAGT